MKRLLLFAWLAALPAMAAPQAALAQRAQYETLIATHSKANMVPEVLVHRIIVRESKYQASLLGRGGTIGLMQIKLATARALGYSGDAEGLRDPDTNLKYGVRYLAGAYRAAGGDHDRAVKYYAAGYYLTAKQQRLEHLQQAKVGPTATPPQPLPKDDIKYDIKDAVAANKDEPAAKDAPDANAEAASK
jgi:soluble lytic murein transglycosylase-like protein